MESENIDCLEKYKKLLETEDISDIKSLSDILGECYYNKNIELLSMDYFPVFNNKNLLLIKFIR